MSFKGVKVKRKFFTRLSPPGNQFTAETTEAMGIMCLVRGLNILIPGFQPSTSVSRDRHSNNMDNMLQAKLAQLFCIVKLNRSH